MNTCGGGSGGEARRRGFSIVDRVVDLLPTFFSLYVVASVSLSCLCLSLALP